MVTAEKREPNEKHSPLRLLIIGALLTTAGSIITAVVVNAISDDDSGSGSQSVQAANATTVPGGATKAPASATPMLDPAHRDKFVATIGGDLTIDSGVDINGERFVYGASGHCEIGCGIEYDDYIEFNLGRDYKTFRATLGLSDRSPQGTSRRIRVLVDGELLYERDFSLGQSEAVKLDVTGKLRLRIEVLGSHFVYGAIGDPTVE